MHRSRMLVLSVLLLACQVVSAGEFQSVEKELAKVRDAGRELYTRQSSVFGQLPGSAEMAALQMRCRPLPVPKAGSCEMDFDAAVVKRAAALDLKKLRKAPGWMAMSVLPVGITGAYVVESQKDVELLVAHVLPDSPAAGVLKVDDVLIGANGRLFTDPEDSRPELGNALCESQSPQLGGILTLQVVRSGKPINVKIDLGTTIDFAETWPYDCEKTRIVRRDALKLVMDQYPWGNYPFWTPTFLLASGDDAALEMARRHICKGVKTSYDEGTGASAWVGGYALMNLCEYYLLTGDSSVLPAIKHGAQGVSWAQFRSGSWSHGGGKGVNVTSPGMASGGYGEVNCAGLGALVGLSLARQCGIEPYDHTIPRSIRFFGPFCGENLGYGLGSPSDGRTGRMDNGISGMSAMVFHLLGEPKMAERWARSVCYMWMGRERGHADAIFSAAWGPISASLAPRPEFHAFMNHMKWAYEMGRGRDGGLAFMRGSRWTYPNMTAAYGLFMYLPERRLQILGGDSVFAQTPPDGLADAAGMFRRKQWTRLKKFLTGYLAGKPASAAHADYARKLLAAYERMESHASATLKIITKTIADGDVATATVQLDLLAKFVGVERPAAAALRHSLAGVKQRSQPRPHIGQLVNARQILKDRSLVAGGIRDGFAHSPEYITRINEQGFAGMAPEQIAPFVGHFNGNAASGAANALAAYGEKTLPLLRRMLRDSHPGIRAGAIDTLNRIYNTGVKGVRTEVPASLTRIIKLVRPMLQDESQLVRASVSDFVVKLNVLNDDMYAMLETLARQGASVGGYVRHAVKDEAVRIRLAMAIIDGNNAHQVKPPGSYIPMICITSAHLDMCAPYIQTAVETLHNPEVQVMYGFFSNHPQDAAMKILAANHTHPLVSTNLPEMIRVSYLRGGNNVYWDAHKEYAHRIALKLGPKALPIIETHWKAEAKRIVGIAAGTEEKPHWWKPDLPSRLAANRAEWADTSELIRCMYGLVPSDKAMAGLCRHYLQGRWWGAWERARIWDKLIEMGPNACGRLVKAMAAEAKPVQAGIEKAIADKQAAIEAESDRHKKRAIQNEVKGLDKQKLGFESRLAEMGDLVELIKHLHSDACSPEAVRTLCRFYLRRPFGAQYPYITTGDVSYVRPLHAKTDELIRNKLTGWGGKAQPAIVAYLAEDAGNLPALYKGLDEEEAFWKPQWSRKSGAPLARIANERVELMRMREELKDLADAIELTTTGELSAAQLKTLCRIYTHRDWPLQRARMRQAFNRDKSKAAAVRRHAKAARPALVKAVEQMNLLMGKTVNDAVKYEYDYHRDQARSIREGMADLGKL